MPVFQNFRTDECLSLSVADTVRLLAMLTDLECSQNRGIVSLPKDVTTVVNVSHLFRCMGVAFLRCSVLHFFKR
jgi:hypothetical protein